MIDDVRRYRQITMVLFAVSATFFLAGIACFVLAYVEWSS